MKTLILVRHALADKPDPSIHDMERRLTVSGQGDAARMAQRLADSGQRVEALFSSPASRALATAEIFAAKFQLTVQAGQNLYDADVLALQQIVRQLDDRYSAVMLVGHNPQFSEFVRYLTEEPYADLPPSGIAMIDLPVMSWKHTFGGKGILKAALCPDRDELGMQQFELPLGQTGRFRLWRIEHARMIMLATVFVVALLLILGMVGLIMHQGINQSAMPQQGSPNR